MHSCTHELGILFFCLPPMPNTVLAVIIVKPTSTPVKKNDPKLSSTIWAYEDILYQRSVPRWSGETHQYTVELPHFMLVAACH